MSENVQKAIESAVVGSMQKVEQNIDEELNRLQNLQEDDIESIRRRRIAQMRQEAENKAMWRRNGHGTVHHISEKDFFSRAKSSKRMVAIFYRKGTSRYADDLIQYITRVSESHLETLFVTLDAEKSPFLCSKLNIRVLPSIIMLKDGEIEKMLIGLDQLSPSGNFSTAGIEKRLFEFEMLTDTNIADDE